MPFTGSLSAQAAKLDALLDGGLGRLLASGEASADPGAITLLHVRPGGALGASRVALVGAGAGASLDEDALRTAAGAAARALRRVGGTLAWAYEAELPVAGERQVMAVVEGALLGDHDPARWRTGDPAVRAGRLLVAGAPAGLETAARRAALVARWTNRARELVDGPPNEVTPEGLARTSAALLDGLPVSVEAYAVDDPAIAELTALAAVGRGSANPPRLIVVRYRTGEDGGGLLALVGKGVTFDTGGYFLKQQDDIVRQKADMGGAAAVIGAIGAIAELNLPLSVLAVVPAAENMVDGASYRPSDIIRTAAGLTVEVSNPDAEGRLILADAIWYARGQGATHLVDVATLTGAMRAGMGDMYTGVFANDDAWRALLVAAGEASGDHAWPWPLHPRYRRLLDSRLADLRNTGGRGFGYPIVAAAFIQAFVGDATWAHLDIHSSAYLDEQRDYLGPGATGAGVRLLTELATRLAARGDASPGGSTLPLGETASA